MRISDWSSDVCSSDLVFELRDALLLRGGAPFLGGGDGVGACLLDLVAGQMRANAFAALAHRPQIGGARLGGADGVDIGGARLRRGGARAVNIGFQAGHELPLADGLSTIAIDGARKSVV